MDRYIQSISALQEIVGIYAKVPGEGEFLGYDVFTGITEKLAGN